MGTFWYEWFRLFFNKRKKYIDKKDQLKTIGIFVQEPNEAFIKKYYLEYYCFKPIFTLLF